MRQIRRGVFETNSSSVHSITMCTADEYRDFANGDKWYIEYDFGLPDEWRGKTWITPQEARDLMIKKAKEKGWDENPADMTDEEFLKEYGDWFTSIDTLGNGWFETFEAEYTTPSGEKVVAFGYYGHD